MFERGSSPRVLRGVDAVPRRGRDRRPPAGRRMARDGPLRDAEAEGTPVTSALERFQGMDRGAWVGACPSSQLGRGLEVGQIANQDGDLEI